MPILVLMRHGATFWGEENRFAGWGDTPLSPAGFAEAKTAAAILAKPDFSFDVCYTSELVRAQQTLAALTTIKPSLLSVVHTDWHLNERHYGALQGETRSAMIEKYGNQKIVEWRRSYTAVPPPLSEDDPRWLEQLQRLPGIPLAEQPRTESMAVAAQRVTPFWQSHIAPDLKAGKCVLVVAHTTSIRGLARAIENLSDEDAANIRTATAVPLVYQLDANLRLISKSYVNIGMSGTLRNWTNWLKPRGWGWI
jgi:2,3-bisphosphoglycerate-dependent phosphoglycerate mutase